MTQENLATRDDDTVTIPRTEYERFLYLTTPKPIETAPRGNAEDGYSADTLLVNCKEYGWIEAAFINEIWISIDGEIAIHNPTHWLPPPTTFADAIKASNKQLNDATDSLRQ